MELVEYGALNDPYEASSIRATLYFYVARRLSKNREPPTEKLYCRSLRDENSIIPESDLFYCPTASPEKQLRSLLCACVSNTAVKQKTCAILSGIIKSSSLNNPIPIKIIIMKTIMI